MYIGFHYFQLFMLEEFGARLRRHDDGSWTWLRITAKAESLVMFGSVGSLSASVFCRKTWSMVPELSGL